MDPKTRNVYLLSFSVVGHVCFTIQLPFFIKGSFILFSFFNNLIPHLLLSFILFLEMDCILTAPIMSKGFITYKSNAFPDGDC